MARQLKQTSSGDLDVTAGRLSIVDGVRSLAQTIGTRCKMVRGEYFADLDQGVPFVGTILVKRPDAPLIRAIFREVIEETPGVTEVEELSYSLDDATRTATLRGRVRGTAAEVVEFGPVNVEVA